VRAESLYGFIERVLQILMPLRLPSPTDVAIRPDGVIGPNQPARDEVDELARCAGDAAVEDKTFEFHLCGEHARSYGRSRT
jgi:hypothetical protein